MPNQVSASIKVLRRRLESLAETYRMSRESQVAINDAKGHFLDGTGRGIKCGDLIIYQDGLYTVSLINYTQGTVLLTCGRDVRKLLSVFSDDWMSVYRVPRCWQQRIARRKPVFGPISSCTFFFNSDNSEPSED
jgi:hypothetical protein